MQTFHKSLRDWKNYHIYQQTALNSLVSKPIQRQPVLKCSPTMIKHNDPEWSSVSRLLSWIHWYYLIKSHSTRKNKLGKTVIFIKQWIIKSNKNNVWKIYGGWSNRDSYTHCSRSCLWPRKTVNTCLADSTRENERKCHFWASYSCLQTIIMVSITENIQPDGPLLGPSGQHFDIWHTYSSICMFSNMCHDSAFLGRKEILTENSVISTAVFATCIHDTDSPWGGADSTTEAPCCILASLKLYATRRISSSSTSVWLISSTAQSGWC